MIHYLLETLGVICPPLLSFAASRLRKQRRRIEALEKENGYIRRVWDSTIGKSPPTSSIESLLQTIESAKPAGVTTRSVIEELLARLP
jgi:DNA-directed RNA polymerase specialized sigma54-like protein